MINVERFIGYSRKFPCPIHKGANWFSLTEGAVAYLIEKEPVVWKSLNYIHTADEIVMHTLFAASPFMKHVHVPGKNGHSNMRLIDWKRGTPYVWRIQDLEELRTCGRFFARKFSSKYMDVVNAVMEMVKEER